MSGLIESTAAHIFRIRFLIRMQRATQLHAWHGPTLFALLGRAHGRAIGVDQAALEDVMIDAPEQCRVQLSPGDNYAFGITLLAPTADVAGERLASLRRGLTQIGTVPPPPRTALGGNFQVVEVSDLVSGKPLNASGAPAAIPLNHVRAEIQKARDLSRISLDFQSPLRSLRPEHLREEGHAWFDRGAFDAAVFVRRLRKRVVGRMTLDAPPDEAVCDQAVELLQNELVWLDVSYGPAARRKQLGGAVGSIVLRLNDPAWATILVWGQYLRAGETTRMGMGIYRIRELGPDPFACRRSSSFVDLAFDRSASQRPHATEAPEDEISAASRDILSGNYRPDPHSRIQIKKTDGSFRELSVPSIRDRALQRRLLATIESGLDVFLETSSFAYRRGLGRRRAAMALRDAYRRGHRFALKADFRQFFDSVDHRELHVRLNAYIRDEPTVELIFKWVTAGAPTTGRGIPTGSPLSPVVSNLFLDAFDEQIAAAGGLLIRYADDFLILFRDELSGQTWLDEAAKIAESLVLELNSQKTAILNLNEPFDFLGFRFHHAHRWQADRPRGLQRVEDLGWYEAAPASTRGETRLPGEQAFADETSGPLVVFGPARGSLRCERNVLICDYRDGGPRRQIPVNQVREVLLLGPVSLTHRAARQCARQDINILLADELGNSFAILAPSEWDAEPDTLKAQLLAADEPRRRLSIARTLLQAKLRNFAALARAFPGRKPDNELPLQLDAAADKMQHCADVDEILGHEGAAAAKWYKSLKHRLPERFKFHRRVAPSAEDPVNILLNIAHTALYRQAALALRLVGLAPGLGILHRPRGDHLALASDLMEPFRHLMERVVLDVLTEVKPGQFCRIDRGPFPVRFEPDAARRLNQRIYEAFEQPVVARGEIQPHSYRQHLIKQARCLRQHVLKEDHPFKAFEHLPP